MKPPDLPTLWASLRTAAPAEVTGDFRMRLCHEAHDLRMFAAVAEMTRDAAIVVELPAALVPRQVTMMAGRKLSVVAGGVVGLPAGRGAIVVRLCDPEFEDLFGRLGDDLITAIQGSLSAASAVQCITRLIERWRRFLEQQRSPLSDEEVRGLIGELAILERSISRVGPETALRAWKSPLGSIRDFEFPDRTIEVKTVMSALGASVRIHGPQQLEPEAGVALYLACQELGRSESADTSLAGHIRRVVSRFAGEPSLVEDFKDALAASGYLPAHAEWYSEGYVLGPLYAFVVSPEFPRIRPSAIPPGVVRVEFSLEIPQLSQFAVDTETFVGSVSSCVGNVP